MKTKWIGWILLVVALFLGCITIYLGEFGDEADNLVVGWLISEGSVLYRDVFSHHFPFAYYWVALVISLFGKSLFFARLSVWLFQIAAFGITMNLGNYHLPLGLAALLWSIIRYLYLGNIVLYNAFCAASLVVVFSITLTVLSGKVNPNWKHWLALGSFATISLLSDPLSVYAALVTLICLLVKDWKWGIKTSFVIAGCLVLYASYLFVSGTIQDFFKEAIWFNINIYRKYIYIDTNPFRTLWLITTRGLDIAGQAWQDFNPWKSITGKNDFLTNDNWFFTGFLYRVALITNVIFLTFQKKFIIAIFSYLFAATTLMINQSYFRSQPFVLISLVVISAMVTSERFREEDGKAFNTAHVFTCLLIGVAAFWLVFRAATGIIENSEKLKPEVTFKRILANARRLEKVACNQSEAQLAYFPGGTYYYWFTDMKPVSRYIYMWPWVAEVGLSEVILNLSKYDVFAVVVREDDLVWGKYDTREYLRPLDAFLIEKYKQAGNRMYLSPGLYARCQKEKKQNEIP